MACEKLPKCIFFNNQMEKMPAVAELLRLTTATASSRNARAFASPPGLAAPGFRRTCFRTTRCALTGFSAR